MQPKMESSDLASKLEKAEMDLNRAPAIILQQQSPHSSRGKLRMRMCKIAAIAVVVCVFLVCGSAIWMHAINRYGAIRNHHGMDGQRATPQQENYRFYVEERGKRVPAEAQVNREEKIEHIKIPAMGDAMASENIHNFDTGFTALISAGRCFIQPLDKNLWKQEGTGEAKQDQVIPTHKAFRTVLPHFIHEQVLRFTAGDTIADSCEGLPTQWIVDKAFADKAVDVVDGGKVGESDMKSIVDSVEENVKDVAENLKESLVGAIGEEAILSDIIGLTRSKRQTSELPGFLRELLPSFCEQLDTTECEPGRYLRDQAWFCYRYQMESEGCQNQAKFRNSAPWRRRG